MIFPRYAGKEEQGISKMVKKWTVEKKKEHHEQLYNFYVGAITWAALEDYFS
jgi:hypothetical protein